MCCPARATPNTWDVDTLCVYLQMLNASDAVMDASKSSQRRNEEEDRKQAEVFWSNVPKNMGKQEH